uniref:Uncharacterized protein n=1 Tax=Ditylenchus dipsaci TaxID=166011 RepID=A0A915CP09_9BILA
MSDSTIFGSSEGTSSSETSQISVLTAEEVGDILHLNSKVVKFLQKGPGDDQDPLLILNYEDAFMNLGNYTTNKAAVTNILREKGRNINSNMQKLCFIAFACCLVGLAQAQMVKQCQCSAITPCKAAYVNSIIPCMDSCQQHAAALGANYGQLKQCLLALEPKLRQTIQCTEGAHSDACANGPGGMVPKRYPETLKIAALSEINRMLGRMGIANEVKDLMSQGKKIYGCVWLLHEQEVRQLREEIGMWPEIAS